VFNLIIVGMVLSQEKHTIVIAVCQRELGSVNNKWYIGII